MIAMISLEVKKPSYDNLLPQRFVGSVTLYGLICTYMKTNAYVWFMLTVNVFKCTELLVLGLLLVMGEFESTYIFASDHCSLIKFQQLHQHPTLLQITQKLNHPQCGLHCTIE